MNNEYYRAAEASRKLAISRSTLLRWEKEKRIESAKRNYLNHRIYTEDDIQKIKEVMKLDVIRNINEHMDDLVP